MKILDRITDERLKSVVEIIREYRAAGYQEMLVEDLVQKVQSGSGDNVIEV